MTRNQAFLMLAIILAAASLELAAAAPKKITSVEGITEYQLENGLRILLFPDSSQSKVTVKMTVVRNEFERGENSPSGVLGKRIAAAAYNWHNYGKPTIGNRSDIERVPIENLRAFYQKFYQPDNIVLIVAGKFEEARALELIQ